MKSKATLIALSICVLIISCTSKKETALNKDFTSYVDPHIGNLAPFLVPTFPTFHLPNQMVKMVPDKKDYLHDQLKGFPLTQPNHRMKKYFMMKPVQGDISSDSWGKMLTIDHDLEIYKPWLYETYLIEDDIKVSYSPAAKGGVFKYQFKEPLLETHLLFQGQFLVSKSTSNVIQLQDKMIKKIKGPDPTQREMAIYAYVVFEDGQGKPVEINVSSGKSKTDITIASNISGELIVKYGISYIDHEQAKENCTKELADKSFDQVKTIGKAAWHKVINQIEVSGGTESQKRTFYTSLYRTYERMVDINEYGRYFDVYTGKTHKSDRPYFVDDWVWDTYRAHHPLRTILNPKQEEDMMQSYVQMYKHSGWIPTFPVVTGNHMCMNAYHSSAIFIDGFRKGLKNFDIEDAYTGVKKNLYEGTFTPWRQGKARTALDDFMHENGYFPSLNINEEESEPMVDDFEKRQPVAVTLGASYDFWALGELAKELGKDEDYADLSQKALYYQNLWHKDHQLFMPKNDLGDWVAIDPKKDGGKGYRNYYDENNGWTYAWDVQQDIPGLINLLGGKEKAQTRLDRMFREPLGMRKSDFYVNGANSTGMVGQFSMGNEPSFHIPYLYNYVGAPWKTQKMTRLLLDVWFQDNLFGIPGDEDGGGMTSFVVFTSLGFYPVTPGLPYYNITSPVFEKSTINLQNGKSFTITAKGASKRKKYIQQAFLNGDELDAPFIKHEDIMAGGELKLILDELPNKSWGTNATFLN
ncbi:MAG: GH92 family glycosyl hydrolase [Reichenbachiella sp.]